MIIDFKSFFKEYKRPPRNQFPTGSVVFTGHQGSGKTLSLIWELKRILRLFPNCVVFSNVQIFDLEPLVYTEKLDKEGKIIGYTRISGTYKLIDNDDILAQALMFQNGENGVIIALDEAHLFFGKKSGISLDVLTAISQQRKDRKRIIFTSQIWEELDISLRKQVKEIRKCRNLFGFIQFNRVSDGETLRYDHLESAYVADHLRTEIFKHNLELYRSYDTYQKVLRNTEYSREFSPTNFSNVAVQVKAKRF